MPPPIPGPSPSRCLDRCRCPCRCRRRRRCPIPATASAARAALRSRRAATRSAAASVFAGMFSCSTGFGSFFASLRRLELRRLLDRNRDLVLAGQLRLARRLLHLVAAAAAAAAGPGLAQPDDVACSACRGAQRAVVSAGAVAARPGRAAATRPTCERERRDERRRRAASAAARTRNGTSAGCAPSTWTDRCPAEALARDPPAEWSLPWRAEI